MIKENGLNADKPIEQYMALAIQPAMVGTFKKEDIKTNIDHITDIIRAGFWLGGIEMPVKLGISPFLAFLYRPFTSRLSHSSSGVDT